MEAIIVMVSVLMFCGVFSGEVKIYPTVDLGKYKKVTIIDFEPAPENPNSGKDVSKLVASELRKKGFEVIEGKEVEKVLENLNLKKSEITENALSKIGEALGVDAIVIGKVPRYEGREAGGVSHYHRPADPRQTQFPTIRIFYTISIELKMLDPKTGSILMEGREDVQESSNLELIEDMARKIVKGMFKKIPKIK